MSQIGVQYTEQISLSVKGDVLMRGDDKYVKSLNALIDSSSVNSKFNEYLWSIAWLVKCYYE